MAKRARRRRDVPARVRRAVIARDGERCLYCGAWPWHRDGSLGLDHVVPIRWGGVDTRNNLVRCCLDCNMAKGSRLILPSARFPSSVQGHVWNGLMRIVRRHDDHPPIFEPVHPPWPDRGPIDALWRLPVVKFQEALFG